MESVPVPPASTVKGAHCAPAGKLPHVMVTLSEKPLVGITLIEKVVEDPPVTLRDGGVTESWKSRFDPSTGTVASGPTLRDTAVDPRYDPEGPVTCTE